MKKLILIFAIIVAFSCSKKEDDKPTNAIDQLPAATQTGANTSGCLVNGQVFLPKGSSQAGPILSCFYQQDQDGYHLGLSIVEKSSQENRSVTLSTNLSELVENNTYNLVVQTNNGTNYNSNFGQFIINSNVNGGQQYYTTNVNIGEIKITKLNTQQKIISGTFWFDAINSQVEIIKIREGRFDMRYVN